MILCSTHPNVFEYKCLPKYQTDDKTQEARDLK